MKPIVELPQFQGPLDLLLHLIKQEKVDIYDIPLAKIADQFIEAVKQMEAFDMEVTSEFLVLAAQLLEMKSRYLLPKPPKEKEESEEDPRQELVERLIAYRAYKEASEALGILQVSSGKRYFPDIDPNEIRKQFPAEEDPLQGIEFDELWKAFQKVLERAEQGEEEVRTVEPDEIPIEVMAKDVLRRIILKPSGVKFTQLLRTRSRMELVVSFLALLELIKIGKIRCEQSAPKHDIYVFPTDKAFEFPEEE